MLDEKELKKTKRVNITGEIPNGRLQILDNNGKRNDNCWSKNRN